MSHISLYTIKAPETINNIVRRFFSSFYFNTTQSACGTISNISAFPSSEMRATDLPAGNAMHV